MELPALDFSKFTAGSQAQKRELAEALVDSLDAHGFVKLINHGVPDEVVESLLDLARRFFEMPVEAKRSIANDAGPHPQRGWSSVGIEQTSKLRGENLNGGSGDELIDDREHFDAGPLEDPHYPNQWPDNKQLPGFRNVMEKTYNVCQNVSLQIMSAIEVGLRLPPSTLTKRCVPAASELRLNHYPSYSIETLHLGKIKRTWPHTDLGIITLLFQDAVGGLELEDRKATHPRTFVPVVPGPSGEMVVNTSDTLQRWTNGILTAGMHQVTVPSAMKNMRSGVVPDRYSGVFFLKAARDVSVGPIPEFVSSERPAAYDEITALHYQQRMTDVLHQNSYRHRVAA